MPSTSLRLAPAARKVAKPRGKARFQSALRGLPQECHGLENTEYDGNEVVKWGIDNLKVGFPFETLDADGTCTCVPSFPLCH